MQLSADKRLAIDSHRGNRYPLDAFWEMGIYFVVKTTGFVVWAKIQFSHRWVNWESIAQGWESTAPQWESIRERWESISHLRGVRSRVHGAAALGRVNWMPGSEWCCTFLGDVEMPAVARGWRFRVADSCKILHAAVTRSANLAQMLRFALPSRWCVQ
ncbi:hypothetical protein Pan181_52710 [Aeoliella mucimassa]|uniref:Uncharacterized protein n=1 Tax=Aeoliella mucimassa TaxID=2527972 RepID=A0A518AWG0_9BACT|nr:hypothetical protein Pan181_52710 [Aeoliella mucimassa]